MPAETPSHPPTSKTTLLQLLQKHKLVSEILHKQDDMPRHDLVQSLVHKQNLVQLSQALEKTDPVEIAQTLEGLPPEDQLIVWDQVSKERKISVLRELPLSVLQVLGHGEFENEYPGIKAFQLDEGRLREIPINIREGLVEAKPIWVDLVDPSFKERGWVADFFGIDLPDPNRLGDLESSARFYVEENGEIHLHSVFLLNRQDVARNVEVAFILHKEILFSVRMEELPVFRMQRLRARSQSNYVLDAWDMLLDLYAADVEYSAAALEDVYHGLEIVGKQVLSKQTSDDDAATMLTAIAHEEDLNGLIRRNVQDTRRAVSFMLHSRFLAKEQLDDAQQILRDIESLDGHTTFLFGKINFLMDATVGFININQNKVIKQLTVISVVFMPLNIIAGIGGMSEFSMMTAGVPWPIAYGGFMIGLGIIAWITFLLLRFPKNLKLLRLRKR
jgi:magnesium transporter